MAADAIRCCDVSVDIPFYVFVEVAFVFRSCDFIFFFKTTIPDGGKARRKVDFDNLATDHTSVNHLVPDDKFGIRDTKIITGQEHHTPSMRIVARSAIPAGDFR